MLSVSINKLIYQQLRWLLLAFLGLLFLARSTPAHAEDPPLEVRITGSGLSHDALREAIHRELHRSVVAVGSASSSERIQITLLANDQAKVQFRRADGSVLERKIHLPKPTAARLQTVAWLVGNLVRNEAEELLKSLRPPVVPTVKPPPATNTPPPEDPTKTSPPDDSKSTTKQPAKTDKEPPLASVPKAENLPSPPTKTQDTELPTGKLPLQPFNASLVSPIALYPFSNRLLFQVELGLGYSHVGGTQILLFNPLTAHVEQSVQGFSFAGLGILNHGNSTGATISGIGQIGQGYALGFYASGLFNIHFSLDGLQAGGIFSYSKQQVRGAQVGGIFTSSRTMLGAQIAAITNINTFQMHGGQFGLINYNHDMSGGQFGLVNYNRHHLNGGQFGLINIASHVTGTQIGLINISDKMDGVPIGVVNYSKDSRTIPSFWTSTATKFNAGLRYFHEPFTSMFRVGWGSWNTKDKEPLSVGVSVGVRKTFSTMFVGLEFDYGIQLTPETWIHNPDTDPVDRLYRLNAIGGWQASDSLGLFAGIGLGLKSVDGQDQSVFPEAQVGIQFF
jgi:hypothetical protein